MISFLFGKEELCADIGDGARLLNLFMELPKVIKKFPLSFLFNLIITFKH